MKITVVTENTSLSENLKAENGLSVYIEKGDTKMLFDVGQYGAIKENADTLGIDLSKVNTIAFSHNHYDHCGGFFSIKDLISSDCRILAHSGFSTRKWWDHRVDVEYGDVNAKPDLELVGPAMQYEYFFMNGKYNFRVVPDSFYEIGEDIYLIGNFPTERGIEEIFRSSVMSISDTEYARDDFRDEMACVIKTSEGLVVLTGCAHNGVMNILNTVKSYFPDDEIYAVIGGTHLVPYNVERSRKTTEYFRNSKIKISAVCHCTGPSIPDFAKYVNSYVKTGAGYILEIKDN